MKALGDTKEMSTQSSSGPGGGLPFCSHPHLLSCHGMNREGSPGIPDALQGLCSMEKPAISYSTRSRNQNLLKSLLSPVGLVRPLRVGTRAQSHDAYCKPWLIIQALDATDRQPLIYLWY